VDLAIGIALGSAVQIATFLYPFVILVGLLFSVGVDMVLPPYLLVALVASSLMVHVIAGNGAATYLSGASLLLMYLCFAFATLYV
jgi:Ca2+:H+ antiporter